MKSLIKTARNFFRELLSRPQTAIGTGIVLFFLILAVFGTQLAPYPDANYQKNPSQEAPTLSLREIRLGDYPFGTDRLGRDVFSRVILGTRS
ncbi:MAG: hypothetical protein K8I82_09005, partial [Anaerolineae bacterium]|nr:hypothetical protein [Anaerolineae bacterium]